MSLVSCHFSDRASFSRRKQHQIGFKFTPVHDAEAFPGSRSGCTYEKFKRLDWEHMIAEKPLLVFAVSVSCSCI